MIAPTVPSRPNHLLDAALWYAALGCAVFPLAAGSKVPAIAKRDGGRGFLDATTDESRIRAWWAAHPTANIGLATGDASGVDVLDIDGPNGAATFARLLEQAGPLPATRIAKTPHGRHVYFRHQPGLKNRARYFGPDSGIDIRTTGGYVVVPPSVVDGLTYDLADDLPPAPWPAALFLCLQRALQKDAGSAPPAPTSPDSLTAYGRGAVERELEAVRGAGEGTRNDTLNTAAFNLAQLHAANELPDVQDDLVAAAMAAGLPHGEATKTVASGWTAGLQKPRTAPPRAAAPRGAPASPRKRSTGTPPASTALAELCTDLGNARRMVRMHGQDLRWTASHGWLVWDGTRWATDDTDEVYRRAKGTVEAIFDEASEARRSNNNDLANALWKWGMTSQSSARIEAAVKLARSEPTIAMRADAFDRDRWALNLPNGTLDLRTGQLRPHRKDDLLTKLAGCAYNDAAPPPSRWLNFLERVIPDADTREFLCRWVGYSLTGESSEQCFVFFYGKGANGKSTFTDTIQAMLGDYAKSAPFDTFLPRQRGQATNDLARLAYTRMVVASEPDEGVKLSESVVKLITGSEHISCRFLHKEYFEYLPEFKVFMVGNYRPRITGHDEGIWRRVRLVPWSVQIPKPERDRGLVDKLRQELPQILQWAVGGLLRWMEGGLAVPKTVQSATDDYRNSEDTIAQFVADRCVEGKECWVLASTFRLAYEAWCKQNGEEPMTQRAVGPRLAERGYVRHHTRNGWRWIGFELRSVTHVTHCDPLNGISADLKISRGGNTEKRVTMGHMGHSDQPDHSHDHSPDPQHDLPLVREPGEEG